ncbi:MAG: WYL domain-containing protein [Gammaproteobacteria bacterium]|nr:MAG: WYL domain-containing protein [Gammaproteobacteria bacterium]
MISRDEILTVADETGLTPNVVEKDYVLGWMLGAIGANSVLSPTWIFKGGTCLKKCYFETYRFSEDLDFTLRDATQLEREFLTTQFTAIAEWLYESAGIVVPADRLVFDIHDNPRGRKSCEGRVYYQSYFAGGKQDLPKIKLDVTADEAVVMPVTRQTVFYPYADAPAQGIHIHCYSYPEVFAEKVRALGERGRPRDLYDVINLFRNDQLPDAAVVQDILSQKCAYKGIRIPVLEDMESYKDALQGNWQPMLAHQLPSLPAFEVYWGVLPEFFNWLEGRAVEEKVALAEVTGSGQVYRPAYGRLGLRTLSGNSLEIIRFAAGNRLCVNLDYTDNEGHRSTRVIEPYSLRRAQNGNILLYAVRAEDGQIRAYKTDQINDASITNRTFIPRYRIELGPARGDIRSVAQTSGWLPGSLGILQSTSRRTRVSRPISRSRTSGFGSEATYIYRCPICDKTFRRKTQNSTLNPHKTKDGWPCSGSAGYLEDITY